MKNNMRVGIGYDVHAFDTKPGPRRPLVLGGVTITTSNQWLDGWSDADVVSHAIIDALLGAAALGDIGSHFPPDEPEYRDISSMVLLDRTNAKLKENGWLIGNIDATIVTEQPKLKDFIGRMRQQLSHTLGIAPGQVSIKASTSEELGFIGRGEGIAAWAVALIEIEKAEA